MSTATLNEQLWATVLESADSFKIDPSCQLFLQAWITNGVERMQNEKRIATGDISIAKFVLFVLSPIFIWRGLIKLLSSPMLASFDPFAVIGRARKQSYTR